MTWDPWGPTLAAALAVGLLLPARGDAQTLRGRVLEEGSDRPVGYAVVRLLEGPDEAVAVSVADDQGRFRLGVPRPGDYRLSVDGLGYEPTLTPLVSVADEDRTYPLDVVVRRSPIGIPGLEVSVDRVERRLRLLVGVSPASLRTPPFLGPALTEHAEKGRGIEGLLRWSNIPGLMVQTTTGGPCFQFRAGARGTGCARVFLDGAPLAREFVDTFPLEFLAAVVILRPNESVANPGGGIYLYTPPWLRR